MLLHGWPGWRADYHDVVPLLAPMRTSSCPTCAASASPTGTSGRRARRTRPRRRRRACCADRGARARPPGARRLRHRQPRRADDRRHTPGRDPRARPRPAAAGHRRAHPGAAAQREYWYQPFHNLAIADALLDGQPDAVRAYLTHFWEHWSAPGWSLPTERFDELVALYSRPGAFTASIAWYRSGSGGVATALAERAPDPDDRVRSPPRSCGASTSRCSRPPGRTASRSSTRLRAARSLEGVGHFTPLEAPAARGRGYGPASTPVMRTRLAGHARVDHVAARPPALEPCARRCHPARRRSASRLRGAPRPRPAACCARSARAPGSPGPRPPAA